MDRNKVWHSSCLDMLVSWAGWDGVVHLPFPSTAPGRTGRMSITRLVPWAPQTGGTGASGRCRCHSTCVDTGESDSHSCMCCNDSRLHRALVRDPTRLKVQPASRTTGDQPERNPLNSIAFWTSVSDPQRAGMSAGLSAGLSISSVNHPVSQSRKSISQPVNLPTHTPSQASLPGLPASRCFRPRPSPPRGRACSPQH